MLLAYQERIEKLCNHKEVESRVALSLYEKWGVEDENFIDRAVDIAKIIEEWRISYERKASTKAVS